MWTARQRGYGGCWVAGCASSSLRGTLHAQLRHQLLYCPNTPWWPSWRARWRGVSGAAQPSWVAEQGALLQLVCWPEPTQRGHGGVAGKGEAWRDQRAHFRELFLFDGCVPHATAARPGPPSTAGRAAFPASPRQVCPPSPALIPCTRQQPDPPSIDAKQHMLLKSQLRSVPFLPRHSSLDRRQGIAGSCGNCTEQPGRLHTCTGRLQLTAHGTANAAHD